MSKHTQKLQLSTFMPVNEYSFGKHDVPLPSELTQYQLSLKAGINPVRVAAADWPVYKLYIFGGPIGGP